MQDGRPEPAVVGVGRALLLGETGDRAGVTVLNPTSLSVRPDNASTSVSSGAGFRASAVVPSDAMIGLKGLRLVGAARQGHCADDPAPAQRSTPAEGYRLGVAQRGSPGGLEAAAGNAVAEVVDDPTGCRGLERLIVIAGRVPVC